MTGDTLRTRSGSPCRLDAHRYFRVGRRPGARTHHSPPHATCVSGGQRAGAAKRGSLVLSDTILYKLDFPAYFIMFENRRETK